MFMLYLVDYVFIVSDIVLKAHSRFPGVVLSEDTTAGSFSVPVASHSQRISGEREFLNVQHKTSRQGCGDHG